MRLLITALGSYGDVYPFVGLGVALHGRGHQVSIITNPHFQSTVESAGLDFLAVGTLADYELLAELENVWHPIRGPMLVMRKGVVEILRELYGVIEANYQSGETVLVAHMLDMASRVFQEKHHAPLASVHLAPLMLRSFKQTSQMGTLLMGESVPRWLRRAQFWMADRLIIDRIIGPELNGLRKELGLAPVRFIMRDWWYSPQLVLGLFPEWFAPPQPDWPANVHLTSFPLWDEPAQSDLPGEVADFLAAGDPPIVFTPGSAMAQGKSFFQAAIEACQLLQCRGILLTKYSEQLPRKLPDSVPHFGFVPFSRLLPRAAAFVHHGGIGSCAQGLAAGLPQLLMPMAYDQPDNAARLERLGVARSLRPRKFVGPAVAQALEELLTDENVRLSFHRCTEQCDARAAMETACDLLENLAKVSGVT